MIAKMPKILSLLLLIPSTVFTAGTTPYLEEIFLGRCWEYQHVVNPGAFSQGLKNCSKLWESFFNGFAYKSPCNVSIDGFYEYRTLAAHTIPPNKHLFWENVFPFANDFADDGKRYWTIAGTLSGYLLDELLWCGQETFPGINYVDCPTTADCAGQGGGDSSEDAVWKAISLTFSDLAEGHVYVMFNGTQGEAFTNDSVFAQYELPNLTPEKGVNSLTLYVVHDLDKPELQSCGEKTLGDFEQIVRSQGLTYSCENDPAHVRHYQCVDNTEVEECQKLPTDCPSLAVMQSPSDLIAFSILVNIFVPFTLPVIQSIRKRS